MIGALVFAWALAFATSAEVSADEDAVTNAALRSYFNLMHGGTAVAFPESRRPVLLHDVTIAPTRDQLRARVSSPSNRSARRLYLSPRIQALVARVQTRSAKPRPLTTAPSGYVLSKAKRMSCGPQYDAEKFTDAVAVSRPVFDRRDRALVYLEYSGGASAYHLTRKRDGWEVDWYVELWACG